MMWIPCPQNRQQSLMRRPPFSVKVSNGPTIFSLWWRLSFIFPASAPYHSPCSDAGFSLLWLLWESHHCQKHGRDWRWIDSQGKLSATGPSLSFHTQLVRIHLKTFAPKKNLFYRQYFCNRNKYLGDHQCLVCSNSLSIYNLGQVTTTYDWTSVPIIFDFQLGLFRTFTPGR